MNHEQATKQQATERYLLGELSDAERDAFEEHYFECAVCADDVRSASTLVDTMRASARQANPFLDRQKAKRGRRFLAPLAAAASLIIGVGATYLVFVPPLQTEVAEARRPYVPVRVALRIVRGVSPEVSVSTADELDLDLPPDSVPAGDMLTCTIVDAQGHVQRDPIKVRSTEIRENSLTVVLPPHAFTPGSYSLHIDGINPPAPPYPFTVVPGTVGPR